jgi:pimeloyl-ACP methyl ester carboxylesterase
MLLFSGVGFAQECRIEGYPYAINCIEIAPQSKQDFLIKVFQVQSTVRYPRPEPIFWLPDGLTLNPTERAPSMISTLSRIRAQRDFMWITFEHPDKLRLKECNPDADSTHLIIADIPHRLDPLYSTEKLSNCIHKISQLSDQAIFSYENIAQLYEETRQKLGLKQVVIVAEGRGAEIALEWQKIAPNAIRFAVMDSPTINKLDFKIEQSISQENALNAVFNACQKSKRCHQEHPNPKNDLMDVISSLPQTITVSDPLTLQKVTFEMNEVLLMQAMQFILRSSGRAKILPLLLANARKGDWQPLVGFLGISWFKKNNKSNLGVFLLDSCRYFDPTEKKRAHGLNTIAQWFFHVGQKRMQRSCSAISITAKKELVFNVPSLVFDGGVDPSRQKLLGFFKRSTMVYAKNAGANLLGYGCTKDVVYRFVKAMDEAENSNYLPDVKSLDADCITQVPYPSMDNIGVFLKGSP